MTARQWKIGDPCFIADVNIERGNMRFRVMPATVVHVAGTPERQSATAMSVNPGPPPMVGPIHPVVEGSPFKDADDAERFVRQVMRENFISKTASLKKEGTAFEVHDLPADVPSLGQVIYGIDHLALEIFEARVGYLRYEYGRLDVGYDPSPGNPESSNVRIAKWWYTPEEAKAHALANFAGDFVFVSKEQLAARTNAAIDDVWKSAAKFIKENMSS